MNATGEIRERDWRAGYELLGRVAEAGEEPDVLARAAVAALPGLVASELTTLSVCDLRSHRRHVVGTPDNAIGDADRAAFDRHFRTHPLVRYHADARGTGAQRIGDTLSLTQFRDTALYCDYYRRIGIDHVVALPLFVDDRTLVSFVLNRRGRDFADREKQMLDLVGPTLSRLYLGALARQRLQHDVHALRALLAGEALPPGGLARLTPREREVLRWVAAGKADRDIAELLACSHRTVHKHLQRVYLKLGVETRTAAAMRWLDGGATGAPPPNHGPAATLWPA